MGSIITNFIMNFHSWNLVLFAAASWKIVLGQATSSKTIAELVVATPRLSTLLAAVQAADLVDTLGSEGPFTVFAPINKAFEKIPEATLTDLLGRKDDLTKLPLRHVVPANLPYAKVPMGNTKLETASGDKIVVNKNNLGITIKSAEGNARVYL